MFGADRREAIELIRRFVKGLADEDLLGAFTRRLGLRSVHQLCGVLELRSEDFQRIGLREEDLCRLLEEFLHGKIELCALRRRVRSIHQMYSASEHVEANGYRPAVFEALSLLSLVLDAEAPIREDRIPRYLRPIVVALSSEKPIPFARILDHVLGDLGEFHFTVLDPLEVLPSRCFPAGSAPEEKHGEPRNKSPGHPPWSDLALLYGAPSRSKCPSGGGEGLLPVWFIPLSVTTLHFYRDELPGWIGSDEHEACCMLPQNCQISRLKERHPWLPLDRYRPAYLVDPRGFAEIVLDISRLSRRDLAFAIQVFALKNGAHAASLDGKPVELYPGAL